ncbi:MAG: DUF4956 domain-containing protein [Clostridiales bacterium]|nr:DUF4956 domain-containing protein [Clostridiales bacterium]
MKELLYNLLYDGATVVPLTIALQNMGIGLFIGILISITYRLTYTGVAYSKKFNNSLMMLSLITTMVMNILSSSLALSLGMVGALSIIRFRTAVKDPRDTTYIFWAIAAGLGAGSSNYNLAIVGTLFIAFITIIANFGFKSDDSYLVIVRGSMESMDEVRAALFKAYKACKLRAETVTDEYTEIVYQVKLRDKSQIKNYESMKKIKGVTFINMVARDGETLG